MIYQQRSFYETNLSFNFFKCIKILCALICLFKLSTFSTDPWLQCVLVVLCAIRIQLEGCQAPGPRTGGFPSLVLPLLYWHVGPHPQLSKLASIFQGYNNIGLIGWMIVGQNQETKAEGSEILLHRVLHVVSMSVRFCFGYKRNWLGLTLLRFKDV